MQIHSKRRKRSNSARKRKHMELRAIASFACKVRVQDLGTRMKRAWSNERRHRSFSLVYVSPKWNFYKLKSFSQNSLYFTSFVRSGRITGPVSIFIMGHFVALCAIRAWRTAFLIPVVKYVAYLQYFLFFHCYVLIGRTFIFFFLMGLLCWCLAHFLDLFSFDCYVSI